MTAVAVNTYTHSVTYVADNILKSFKDIIKLVGLDPSKLVQNWDSTMRGLTGWMDGQYLTQVVLEIFNPKTGELITRWDMDIVYSWTGDGGFWTDTEQLRYNIRKAGLAPSEATYRLILIVKPDAPDVAGWGDVTLRSTAGMVRQSLGSTVEHTGLGANAAYWRKV
jgi:hypothetical protein